MVFSLSNRVYRRFRSSAEVGQLVEGGGDFLLKSIKPLMLSQTCFGLVVLSNLASVRLLGCCLAAVMPLLIAALAVLYISWSPEPKAPSQVAVLYVSSK